MKVLWVTNTIFPDLANALGLSTPVSGGWMFGLAKDLAQRGIGLTVTTAKTNFEPIHKKIEGINYYVLGAQKHIEEYDPGLEHQWKEIISEENPDLVHIHGMEYAHGLALVKAYPDLSYVASIQGILYECYKYYTGQIDPKDIRRHITLRDILKRDSILDAQKKYLKRSQLVENEYFARVKHIMGRSQWDKDYAKSMNKDCKYHRCNDSLRDAFYKAAKWDIKTKENHSIFLSQASYPLKGLHMAIMALAPLKSDYPGLKIRVAGVNIMREVGFINRLRMNGYANYLRYLIKKLGMQDKIEFMGVLNEEEMVQTYLRSHIFISPTSIDNCSNSVGEAQLLGVPCIASYVGGVPDMIQDGKTGFLYRFEAVHMLSQRIRFIFENDKEAMEISRNAIKSAMSRHDREQNVKDAIKMYQKILAP